MNKARRNELKQNHFRRRLKNLCLKLDTPNSNFNAFRTTGKPCSCSMCQPPSDNYKRKKINKLKLLNNDNE